jgi:hypothetical protein
MTGRTGAIMKKDRTIKYCVALSSVQKIVIDDQVRDSTRTGIR